MARAGEAVLARRAEIVLLAASGMPNAGIAARTGASLPTVGTWRARYARDGIDGLRDRPRPGRRSMIDGERVRALAAGPPPPGAARWSVRRLAAETGLSPASVHRIMRGGDPPPSAERAVAVVALFFDPPVGALVLWLGERGTPVAEAPPPLGGDTTRARLAAYLDRVNRAYPDRVLEVLVDDPALATSQALEPWRRARPGLRLHPVPEATWLHLIRTAQRAI